VPRNVGDRRAKRDEVIQTNAGDDTDDGVDDIGGVKSPACSYFHNGNIDAAFGKPPIADDAPRFGIADWRSCLPGRKKSNRCVQHRSDCFSERASIDQRRPDLELLGRHLNVGRGAQTDPIASRGENAGNRSGCGAFA
jgi:hypothetical protein